MPANNFLSQDAVGFTFDEEVLYFMTANETSAHGISGATIPVGIMKKPGRIAAAFVGVGTPAVSASGFVSGTVDAQVRINSATVMSTLPSIAMAGSAGQAGRRATNFGGAGVTSGVVNQASAAFSAGAMISIDYNARSVGSAAATAAGTGVYVGVLVRYEAI
ncbi:hypothetical protein UFOVP434_52 [uncultured Caudovirales phage]|uniref:Uncharacterized protein n=1 Tax=uncultured Caudovirales phage TaxID=2100421 RepID=A0A6J5M9S8_9CAUD|nr:hypothetical protein UFOVP434_52 [uncultured Caudovirales phage]